LGLSFPLKDITIAGKSLKDLFMLEVSATVILDFGNTISTISSLISQIKSANTTTGKTIVSTIMNAHAEATFEIKGKFALKISDLTNGFLPDLVFDIGSCHLLVANGTGNASGMSRGIYLFLAGNVLQSVAIFNTLINQFSSILKLFGIPTPTLDVTASFGMFIQDDSLGFAITTPVFGIKCFFVYSSKTGGCDFNLHFFTVLLETAQWVVKFARKLLDNTGAEVMRFTADISKFASNAAAATASFFNNDVRNFFQRDVSNAFTDSASTIANVFKNDVGGAFKSLGVSISDGVVSSISTVTNAVGSTVKKIFSGW